MKATAVLTGMLFLFIALAFGPTSSAQDEMSLAVRDGAIKKEQMSATSSWGVDLIGYIETSGSASSVALKWSYAYVAAGSSGVHVIDISDPSSPALVATFDTPGRAVDIAIKGDYAFVADSDSLRVLDISNPTNPISAGSHESRARHIVVIRDYIYATAPAFSSECGVAVFDISDPTNPVAVGSYTADCYLEFTPMCIASSENHVFALSWWGNIAIFDLQFPTNPSPSWYTHSLGEGGGEDISIDGTCMYVAGNEGLLILDISDPLHPAEIGMLEVDDFQGIGVTASQSYAFCATANRGLSVIDVSNPASPGEVGMYETGGSARHAAFDGELVYLADSELGFFVLKPLGVGAQGLVLQPGPEGKDAHVDSWNPNTNYGDSEWFYGVGQPSREVFIEFDISSIPAGSDVLAAMISQWAEYMDGNIVFEPVASAWDEMTITWENRPATVLPEISYPISRGNGVLLFEITDIVQYWVDNPSQYFGLRITADTPGYGWMMASSDNSFHPGPKLSVIYLEPEEPVRACLDCDPNTLNRKSKGRWITCYIELPEGYDVADIDGASLMLNDVVPAEAHPIAIGDYDGDGIADLMVKFDRSAVIDLLDSNDEVPLTITGSVGAEQFIGTDYIRVIEPPVFPPEEKDATLSVDAVSLHVHPNPFNPSVHIVYSIPNSCRVLIQVWDINGRLVRTVEDAERTQGIHTSVWNGKNEAGRPVASGVYFCRLSAGNEVITEKLMLLR